MFSQVKYTSNAQKLLSTMTGTVNAYVAEVVKFARYDYHEFAELSLLYLDAREDKVSFHNPDAFHNCC